MNNASKAIQALGTATFPPGYGPEWGSGGVYGLRYHNGILYFTLSFEAIAYFITAKPTEPRVSTYRYNLVGHGSGRSGGDTYNASAAVDDKIFFGGWVHAPPIIRDTGRGRELDFTNKYAHIHVYNISEDRVELLWHDTISHPREWAGEVSEIIYNPVNGTLYVARGDGHDRLGVYEIDMKGRARRIDPHPVLKGSIHLDHACFTLHGPGPWKQFRGYTCIDVYTGRRIMATVDPSKAPSPDNQGVEAARAGSTVSAYTRLYAMVRGGVFLGDPVNGEDLVFYRLLDFYPSNYGPLRVNSITPLATPVTVWNNMSHATIAGTDELPTNLQAGSRRIIAPSLMISLDGPAPRIVAALGVRATSIEHMGDSILVGYSTAPNLERYDATRLDSGTRGLAAVPLDTLQSGPRYGVTIRPPPETAREGRVFGGIPLAGYSRPRVVVKSREGVRLEVYTYTIGDPPGGAEVDVYNLEPGRVEVDLSGHGWGIVSFRVAGGRIDDMLIHLS